MPPSPRLRSLTLPVLLLTAGSLGLSVFFLLQDPGTQPAPGQPRPAWVTDVKSRPKPGESGKIRSGSSGKRIATFRHANGWRTETQKTGDSLSLRQHTFDVNNTLAEVRIFKMDAAGHLRNGVIYDGRKTPMGSTKYIYDSDGGQLLAEELFDKNGKLVRRLYYPGALKDPKFASRQVAFSFNPDKAKSREVEIEGPVSPIVPQTQDGGEFEPLFRRKVDDASQSPVLLQRLER